MPMSPYIRDLRAQVGRRRLLMPSVAGIVRDARNRVLLVRQQDNGVWSTPGGIIEMEDTPADAVVREVWEETGLVVRPSRIIGVYGGPNFVVVYPNGDETQYISCIFECEVLSGEPRAGDDEISEVQFWSRDEARGLPMSPWLPLVLDRLFDATLAGWFEPPRWRPLGD
jgi:ADP-ribose pyrophosphatase YjhB (NUDIX family)